MKKKGVAICIRNDKGQILLLKRGPGHRYAHTAGEWEQCGGGVNEEENYEEAAVREVREELDGELEIVGELIHDNYDGMGDGIVWDCVVFEGRLKKEPKIMEPEKCVELKWVEISELKQMNLTKHTREDFEKLGWR